MFMTFGFTFFFMPRCCSSSSRALSFSWPISTLLKSYCDPAWPNRWLSSAIHSYCLSRFVAAVTWPALSFASACKSCSSFLIATSASEAACLWALITSSRS
ncbi:hypothetical protein BC827DRAFT_1224580, partial [Russula dissimulans]